MKTASVAPRTDSAPLMPHAHGDQLRTLDGAAVARRPAAGCPSACPPDSISSDRRGEPRGSGERNRQGDHEREHGAPTGRRPRRWPGSAERAGAAHARVRDVVGSTGCRGRCRAAARTASPSASRPGGRAAARSAAGRATSISMKPAPSAPKYASQASHRRRERCAIGDDAAARRRTATTSAAEMPSASAARSDAVARAIERSSTGCRTPQAGGD